MSSVESLEAKHYSRYTYHIESQQQKVKVGIGAYTPTEYANLKRHILQEQEQAQSYEVIHRPTTLSHCPFFLFVIDHSKRDSETKREQDR